MNMYIWLIVALLTHSICDATRISFVDGLNTSIIEYPHQVSILRFKQPICSGAIVSRRHILTTASCTYPFATLTLRVRMGSSEQAQNGFLRRVYRIHEHPDFNRTTFDYNIAILELWTKIPILDEMIPISIGTKPIPVNTTVEIIGWGAYNNNVSYASGNGTIVNRGLQRIKLTVINNDACRAIYSRHNFTITDKMMCAMTSSNGYGTCRDDLGATLLYNSDLYGLLSYQVGCAMKKYPAVFTNIISLRDFTNSFLHKYQWRVDAVPEIIRRKMKKY